MPKLGHTADPLWELSSFSEAAMAAAQAPEMYCLTHRYRSLARARQLPHLIHVAAKIPDLPPIPVGAVEL